MFRLSSIRALSIKSLLVSMTSKLVLFKCAGTSGIVEKRSMSTFSPLLLNGRISRYICMGARDSNKNSETEYTGTFSSRATV